jgi:hypothetical protein
VATSNNAMHLSIGAFVIMVAPLAGDRERSADKEK